MNPTPELSRRRLLRMLDAAPMLPIASVAVADQAGHRVIRSKARRH